MSESEAMASSICDQSVGVFLYTENNGRGRLPERRERGDRMVHCTRSMNWKLYFKGIKLDMRDSFGVYRTCCAGESSSGVGGSKNNEGRATKDI